MKHSSRGSRRARLLAVLCLLAAGVLLLAGAPRRRAEGSAAPGGARPEPAAENVRAPEAAAPPAGNFTLNKFVYPGATTFTSLSPTLTTSAPQINVWSIGVPILYAITIGNSDPAQTSLVDITLRDGLAPASLDPNFVILDVACDAFNGAVCPFATDVPPPGTTLPLAVPNIKVKVGAEVVVRIRGYYKTQGTFQNTFSVETQTPGSTPEQGPPKTVQIDGNWAPIDLKVSKASSTSDAALPATIHYTVTLTGDSAQDFYPGSLLSIQDTLTSAHPPLPTYAVSNFACSSPGGSTCPAAPAAPSVSFSGSTAFGNFSIAWPAGPSTVIRKGDAITLTFDITVTTAAQCGASITVQNQAQIRMSGFTYADANNGNNSINPLTSDTFTTGLPATCLPAAGVTKTRVCPSGGCPPLSWGDTVTYQIVVTNNTNTPRTFVVYDNVSKGSITVPLRATLVPTGSPPAPVQCAPSSVACTTTPSSPQDLVADLQQHQLFQTKFTLAASGSAGSSVTLTFDVKIEKLADCQTDPGNVFTNSGSLFLITGSSQQFVSGIPAVNVNPPDLPLCQLLVTKARTQPAGGVTFGQPVTFTITYENQEPAQAVTVRRLRDMLNLRDAANPANPYAYGTVPVTGLSANCVPTGGVSPLPTYQQSVSQITASLPDWQGVVIIEEPASPATGITFQPGAKLTCTVTFTPHPPPETDNLCQGVGQPEIVNTAAMDVSGVLFSGGGNVTKPPHLAQAAAALPLCRKVAVLKTPTDAAGNAVSSTGPGGVLNFQIKVTNFGNHPVGNFLLNDLLPAGFTYVAGTLACAPAAACASAAFTGGTLGVAFNPLPGTQQAPSNTATISFQVNAPLAGGTYFNTATGSFAAAPGGPNFYFEGDPGVLLVNSAQVQVLTPTLSKSFAPGGVAVNGTATLQFTVNNQTSNPPQSGISFTDQLPAGVTVTSAPPTACGGTLTVSGGNTLTLSGGALAQGQPSCTFSVVVTASSCGTFRNDRTNFSQVTNLDVTGADATLDVTGCVDPTPTPSPSPSNDACSVKAEDISCKADGAGGHTYTFVVTNTTGLPVIEVLVTPPHNAGFGITPQRPPLPGGVLDPGQSATLQVTISGARGGEPACFAVTLMTRDGPCCTVQVCPALPDCCAKVAGAEAVCRPGGSYSSVLSIVNTSADTVRHVYLHPPPGVTVTPNYFPVTLAPGDTFQTPPLTITGTGAGRLCLRLTLHTDEMKECCTVEHCFALPACPRGGSP